MDIWYDNAGLRLYAKSRGSGTPVVMLHGGMGVHTVSEPYVAAVGDGFQVLTPDVRGCGASVCRDPAKITWDAQADDIAALMDQVGAAQGIVAGVSGGSGAAVRFALAHPDRLVGLVLIHPVYAGAAAGYTPFQAGQFASMGGLSARAASEGAAAFAPMFAAAGPRMQAVAEAFVAAHDVPSVAGWGDFMASGAQPFNTLSDLGRITAPTLIIPGVDDMHPRAIAEQYRAALPNAQWFEPPDGDGDAAPKAIAAFCESLSPHT